MADHVSLQLSDAVVSAVTGLATTGARVFPSRVYALQDADLPGLRVYPGDESNTARSIGVPVTNLRMVQVVIDGVAKANANLDRTLRAMQKEVEIALGAGLTVGGKFVLPIYAGCDIILSGEGEHPTGTIALRFEAQLLNRATTPDVFS